MANEDPTWLDDPLTAPDGPSDAWESTTTTPEQVPTKYALALDSWGQRRGEDLVAFSEFEKTKVTAEDAADMFGLAFDYEPKINPVCEDPHKKDFAESMLSNDEYQALRNSTRLDSLASELAALAFSQKFVAYRVEREKQDKQHGKGKDGPPDPKAKLRQEMKTAGNVKQAVDAAQTEVQDLEDARKAMGIGSEGSATTGMNPADVKKMFHRVKNNPSLRQMLNLAGRYRVAARAKQRNKVKHGFDDMVGVVMGNDIPRLLPTELAALGDPYLRMDAVRRFVERGMYQRDYRGTERVAKGPIIVIVDESGSMSGSRIANAKGLALAMAWVARHQNRWCGFIGFSGRGQVRSIALPPDKWPTDKVMKWLEDFLGGGTTLPTAEIPKLYTDMGAPKGKTDLICITDGDVSTIDAAERQRFLAWKQASQCKFIGISIASAASIVEGVSDEFYRIPSLSPDNDAVERCLSI